jgi:hypothetical protein
LWTAIIAVIPFLPSRLAAESDGQTPYLTREHVQEGSSAFRIMTVSARNDLISGNDVLVRIEVRTSIPLARVIVTRNGEEVTAAFRPLPGTPALLGLVKGLRLGENVLAVGDRDQVQGPSTRLTVTNYSVDGPIISGPHETPYICMTNSFHLPVTGGTLGAPLDEDCSIATRVDYVYRSQAGFFKPLAVPTMHPADLAFTTTNRGRTVPYIVRVETGTINRAIYQTAMLHDPGTDPAPTPWSPPAGWNGRLVYKFGGGCPGGWYVQGSVTDGVLEHEMLSLGYATASATANVFGNNCSDLLAAETMMMVKERFIENYGQPTGTIGWGCSGGSYQAHQIGDNYPGLLDGIVVGCSFPDVGHAAMTVHSFGSRLLYHYFTESAALPWTRDQQVAASGLPDYSTLVAMATRADRINPRGLYSQAFPVKLLYDPRTNPGGVRCTVYDHLVNVYGRDPKTRFARRFLDNVGVQYGLGALNRGVITPAQFLDLNEKIGGVDMDANFTPGRTVGDPVALRIAYASGRVLNGGGGLASLPMIDYRAYTDAVSGDLHMRFHSFSTRARLLQANGQADNQVMLVESDKYGLWNADSPVLRGALRQMDQWLLNLAKDTSDRPQPERVVQDKPADLVDACFTESGAKIAERQVYQGATACNRLYPSHASPYLVAGMPLANNVAKCQLKPIDTSDYRVDFTPAETDRLHRVFPTGVCDYSKPGVDQRPLKATWLSFGPAGAQASQD